MTVDLARHESSDPCAHRSAVSIETHLHGALQGISAVDATRVPLHRLRGRVLAADVLAPGPLPAFDNSAMDGYAVRAADVRRDLRMPIGAEIAAGERCPAVLPPGVALPIMTGAPLPVGADVVVPVEMTVAHGDRIEVAADVLEGQHIRRRGEELRTGEVVVTAGTTVSAPIAGALAALGVDEVPVHRRPRVAVLSTGRELVAPGLALRPGGVHDANTTLLADLLEREDAEVTVLSACDDDPRHVRSSVETAVQGHDLVVTTGGVSQGTHEVVRQALTPDLVFRRVAMAPGGPQGLGHVGGVTVLALPGNPAAALVAYCVFVRPVVRALGGHRDPSAGWRPVRWVDAARSGPADHRVRFHPVVLDHRRSVTLARSVGSAHRLSSYAGADAVMRVGPRDRIDSSTRALELSR